VESPWPLYGSATETPLNIAFGWSLASAKDNPDPARSLRSGRIHNQISQLIQIHATVLKYTCLGYNIRSHHEHDRQSHIRVPGH
jgi:hypothetical protein